MDDLEVSPSLSARGHLLALTAYTVLSLVWFLPLPFYWFSRFPGFGDIWLLIWNFWWMDKALVILRVSPFWTDWAFFPTGVDLSMHALAPFNSLLAIPLMHLGGLPFAYNMILLAAFVLSGYAVFLIAWRLTGDARASGFAGYVYAFSPYHWSHLHHLEHLSIQGPAFLLWAFLEAQTARERGRPAFAENIVSSVSSRSRTWMILAAVFFLMTYYTNPYLGLFSALMALLILTRDAWVAMRPLSATGHRNRVPRPRWVRSVATDWVIFGLVAGAGILPHVMATARVATSEGQFAVPLWIKIYQSADLLALITPSPNNPWLRSWFPLMPLYRVFTAGEPIAYLGWSVIGLAAWGALKSPIANRRLLTCGAAFFIILALGPVLHVAGILLLPGAVPIPMPQSLLQVIPVISAARVPARYLSIGMLFVALLAGIGVHALLASCRRPRVVFALLAVVLVLEYWNAPLIVPAPREFPYTKVIAADPRDVAVLDLPLRIAADPREWWRAMDPDDQGWRQILHGKRSFTGSISHTALNRRHFLFFLHSPLLAPLVSDDEAVRVAARSDTVMLRREAMRLRMGYAVLNLEKYAMMRSMDLVMDRDYLRDVLGAALVYKDHEAEVWRLGEMAAANVRSGDVNFVRNGQISTTMK